MSGVSIRGSSKNGDKSVIADLHMYVETDTEITTAVSVEFEKDYSHINFIPFEHL